MFDRRRTENQNLGVFGTMSNILLNGGHGSSPRQRLTFAGTVSSSQNKGAEVFCSGASLAGNQESSFTDGGFPESGEGYQKSTASE
jgi:hypothetical protein